MKIRAAAMLSMATLIGACVAQSVHTHTADLDADTQLVGDLEAKGDFLIDTRDFEAVPYSHTDFDNDPDNFQFAIVSDRTGGHRTPIFKTAIGKINLLQPEFVVSVGDMIEGYSTDPETLQAQWTEFNGFIDALEAPYFYTPGNHDYSNDVMADLWKEKYGATYYHFVYKDVLFLVLNTEEALNGVTAPGIDDAQFAYVSESLDKHPDVRWTMVMMHQPLWDFEDAPNWAALEEKLSARNYTAIAGHMHTYDYATSSAGHEHITLGSTGGGSQLRGKTYGEFDHIVWITMDDDGPILANLSLDGIDDRFITTPEFDAVFDKSAVFLPSPWFVEDLPESGSSHALDIKIDNPFDEPLAYSIEPRADPAYRVSPSTISGELEVGQSVTETLEVTLLDTPSDPLDLSANGTVDLGNGKTADWTETVRLAPVRQHSIAKADASIDFDGDLSEWSELRFTGGEAGEDGSFSFDVTYDDTFLYVGVNVADDEVMAAKNALGFDFTTDMASIQIDGRPASVSAGNIGLTTDLKYGHWMFIGLVPDGEVGEVPFRELIPESFRAVMQETETGYTAEFALPVQYLDYKYGAAWKDFRLNVFVNDMDPSKSAPAKQVTWQPDWQQNVFGTGIFARKQD